MNFVTKPANSGSPASENSAPASTPASSGARSRMPRKSPISSLPVRLYQAMITTKIAMFETM